MSKLDELTQQVSDLQFDLDAEQEQIRDALGALQTAVGDLTALLGTRPTDEQMQAVIDQVRAVREDLSGTIADSPPAES